MVAQSRVDVLKKLPLLARLLKSQIFRPALVLVTLFVFTLAILTGWFGTPAGSRNFGIVFVWIVWWALLIVVLVPFFGRLWCMICPIPAPGEWLQRRGIIQRTPGKPRSLHRRWHRRLKNMWLQNFGFLTIATFSVIILTRPNVSAWVLFGFVVLALVLSQIFDNRVFCRYVCPVGGFIGLYAMMAPLELRARDCAACRSHKSKDCVTGNAQGYGCPWMVYPGNLQRNTYCGLCMECLKTCPQDNITINTRPFGADLFVMKEHRLDEAYKAFIMLTCALLYSVVLLGPWGWLKNTANMDTLPSWLVYAAAFWAINLLAVPGLFAGVTVMARAAARQTAPIRQLFIDYAYALVPLGLAAWIAFSLGFVFANGSYALAVISDPFGWGWNLLGTANQPWMPILPGLVSLLQVGVLTGGLLFGLRVIHHAAEYHSPGRALRATLPFAGLLAAITLAFLWLYLG
jgi:ferredoxin